MRDDTSCWRWAVVVFGALVALTGCTYAAVPLLPLDEQAAFHTYSKVMTGVQMHTYVAKATRAAACSSSPSWCCSSAAGFRFLPGGRRC